MNYSDTLIIETLTKKIHYPYILIANEFIPNIYVQHLTPVWFILQIQNNHYEKLSIVT